MGVEFLHHETGPERVQLAKFKSEQQLKDINDLHAVLGHPSVIAQATGYAMRLHFTGMFKPCEMCALGLAKKRRVSKNAVEHSKLL